jgi:mevalonate kinase
VALATLVERLTGLGEARGLVAPTPGTLTINSEIVLGSGFGSSGALCAALVNLFWPDQPLESRDRLAWEAEAQFHGTPSGIDTALALREGWWALDPSIRPPVARSLEPPTLTLVVGALVRESSTRSLVGELARRRAAGDPRVTEALGRLGTIATRAVDCLGSGQSAGIPPLVSAAREDLRGLGLESPTLTRVLDGATATGALAGKLSGAGGGGAFLLVFPDPKSAEDALPTLGRLAPEAAWTKKPVLI